MSRAARGRRIAAVLVAALTVLAGCGGNDGSGRAGAATDSSGVTTLTWAMWSGGTAERDAWQAAADAVTAADPSIRVTLETTSFSDYFTKIGTRIAGGAAPCIVGVQSLRLGALTPGLLPLDDLVRARGLDTADFVLASLAGLQSGGQQYAIPYDNGPMFIVYNKDRFAERGVPEPSPTWTQADFLATARALTGDGRYGIAAFPSDLVMFSQVFSATGVQPVNADGTLQLTDPALVAGATDYAALVSPDGVAPELSSTDSTAPYQAFTSGQAAMVADGPWDLLSIQSQSDFALGVVPMPAGPQGSRTLSAGSGFGISRSCPDPDKAFTAISTITGQGVLNDLAGKGRAFPSRVSAQQAWYDQAPAGAKEALDTASASAEPMRVTQNWAQLSDELLRFGLPAFNGTTPMADVLQQVQTKYQSPS